MGKRVQGNVQERVYCDLREDMMMLRLKPGTPMSANETSLRLTEKLQINVSRTPVREAFLRLAKEGLVDIEPQKGTFVSRIDLARVNQERFLRATLELANINEFWRVAKPSDFERLHKIVEEQSAAVYAEDFETFAALDNAFHHTFFEVSGQTLAAAIISSQNGHYDRIRLMTALNAAGANAIIAQHLDLLGRLERGDREGTLRVLQYHLSKLEGEEQPLTRAFPDYFVQTYQSLV